MEWLTYGRTKQTEAKPSWRTLLLTGLLLGGFASNACSGTATLHAKELPALRALIASDTRALGRFNTLRELADASLGADPAPVRSIHSEGRLDTDPAKIATRAALKDMPKIKALAWTWAVTENAAYAEQARTFILAWAKTNQSDGNPINETKFEPLVEAYDLLRPTFAVTERALVDEWLARKASALWENPRGHKENWQSHRLKMTGLIAATLQDKRLWEASRRAFRRHILENFDAAGVSIDFVHRDAMHYHLYAVQPLLTLACVARRQDENWIGYTAPDGASLEKAVDFIVPYALGEKRHLEFANSRADFDRTRAKAGQKQYAPHYWNPKQSLPVFAEAGCVSGKYQRLVWSVFSEAHGGYPNWRAVLNAASPPGQ